MPHDLIDVPVEAFGESQDVPTGVISFMIG